MNVSHDATRCHEGGTLALWNGNNQTIPTTLGARLTFSLSTDVIMVIIAIRPTSGVFYFWLCTLFPIALLRTYIKMRTFFADLAKARETAGAVELKSLFDSFKQKRMLRFPAQRWGSQRFLPASRRDKLIGDSSAVPKIVYPQRWRW